MPRTQWAEDVEKEPIRWAIPDYIPRRVVSSIYGPRNSGKTMAVIWLAASASSGVGDRAPLRVWFNSQEDDLPSVLKPRFDAAGIPDRQVRLTAETWRLPGDLNEIRNGLNEHRAGRAPDDMLILDSIQQHITRPYALDPSQRTIKGLLELAIEFDIAVVLVGHTTKGKHASVEAMIAGSTVLQNMSKAIYVFGAEPGSRLRERQSELDGGETGNPRFVLACERMGVAPKPVSILLEQMSEYDNITKRNEPYLEYLGPSVFTAREVIDEAKTDDKGGRDAGKSAAAAEWIVETLTERGPTPTKDLEAMAKADGVYGSRNTFDRARKIAGVHSYKEGSQWWVRLKDQDGDDPNSPNSPSDDGGHEGDEDGSPTPSLPASGRK